MEHEKHVMTQFNRRQLLQRVAALTGVTLSAPLVSAILSGISVANAEVLSKNALPGVLSEAQLSLVAEMADMIIPDTDTPGAKAAGVPDFIQLMVSEWYYPPQQKSFMDGLAAVDSLAGKVFGKIFLGCSQDQRVQLMQQLDDDASRAGEERIFFQDLKELTLTGYFTSQIGAEDMLRYEAVPGPYEGCVPLEQIGRTWRHNSEKHVLTTAWLC